MFVFISNAKDANKHSQRKQHRIEFQNVKGFKNITKKKINIYLPKKLCRGIQGHN